MHLINLIKSIFTSKKCSKNNHLWKIITPTLARRAVSSRKSCLCGHYSSHSELLQEKSEEILNSIKG